MLASLVLSIEYVAIRFSYGIGTAVSVKVRVSVPKGTGQVVAVRKLVSGGSKKLQAGLVVLNVDRLASLARIGSRHIR
jgi:hypothetical protein